MSEKITTKDTRTRAFSCIVYPDSAPDNWQTIISEMKIPFLISPLHDKDINPGGEFKKPHYHVIAYFEGKKSLDQARFIFESFGGVGCENVNSLRGYARYLCHLDNPEKAQYDISEVLQFGGADYSSCIDLPTDRYKLIKEMKSFCDDNNIDAFCDLFSYAADYRYDWFRILCDNSAYVMERFLKSKSWKKSCIKKLIIDDLTGEVINND